MNQRVIVASQVFPATGDPVIPDGAVVVADGRIVWVGPRRTLPAEWAGAPTTTYSGTLLPGLIETHAHLASPVHQLQPDTPDPGRHDPAWAALASVRTARQLASIGVTTVQSLGSVHFADVALREAIAAGLIEGPRIVASGPQLTTTGGHAWSTGGEVDSLTEIRHQVRDYHKAGVDLIKVMATGGFMTARTAPWNAQFTTEELRIIVDEAHRLGKHTAAHAHGTEGIRRAVAAGIDYIAHASFVDRDGRTEFDPELADAIAERRIFVDVCSPPSYPPVPGETIAPRALELYERGVLLVAGHDIGAVIPANAYIYGLTQLQAAGLPAEEVLVAATSRAAAAAGLAGLTGAILPGYAADLILTPGNPLVDIGALAELTEIIIGGRTFVPDLVEPYEPALRTTGGAHPNDVRENWLRQLERTRNHPLPIHPPIH